MNSTSKRIIPALAIIVLLGSFSLTTGAESIDARAVVQKSLEAFYYAGDDVKVRVGMSLINSQGKTRSRDMTMLRKDFGVGGDQRYFMYFHQPSEVKGTTFMVWKYPNKEDDRWIFIPSINLVKRIAANDKRSSFVGSDFTYEDVSGREVDDETHGLRGEEDLNGRPCFVIESVPKSSADYAKRTVWIDKEHFLPWKEEYVDARGGVVRVFTADEIKSIDGHWTVTKRTMKNMQTGHRTEVVFTNISYDVGLDDDLFTERYLSRPPMGVIQ